MLLNAGREERTMGSRTGGLLDFPLCRNLAVLSTVILKLQGLGVARLSDASHPRGPQQGALTETAAFEVTSVLILIANPRRCCPRPSRR